MCLEKPKMRIFFRKKYSHINLISHHFTQNPSSKGSRWIKEYIWTCCNMKATQISLKMHTFRNDKCYLNASSHILQVECGTLFTHISWLETWNWFWVMFCRMSISAHVCPFCVARKAPK